MEPIQRSMSAMTAENASMNVSMLPSSKTRGGRILRV